MHSKLFALILLELLLATTCKVHGGHDDKKFTNRWAVEVLGGSAAADTLAKKYGFINMGQISILKDMYHFVMPEHSFLGKRSLSGLPVYHISDALELETNVLYVKQQVILQMEKKGYSPPTDPEWGKQWGLLNTGQLSANDVGRDLNLEKAWLQGITGCGSVVAVVDDGVEYNHSDIAANYDSSIQEDFVDDDKDPFPITDASGVRESHGTRCAGEIAMVKNNSVCGVGVAYNSLVTGIRVLGGSATEIDFADALGASNNVIQIYSNSWGPLDGGSSISPPSENELIGRVIEMSTKEGRDGKGSIYLFASGNGGEGNDTCAADSLSSGINVIGIGAVASNGAQATYDEQCSGKMAVTFVDDPYQENDTLATHVTTINVENTCDSGFVGTSAATPLASGIIALVLEANKNLTSRDVQYLIVYTSNQNILIDGEWIINGATPPLKVSHKFGFGAIDAEAIVTRARTWITVPERQTDATTPTTNTGLVTGPGEPLNITHSNTASNVRFLEHVVVNLTLEFPDATSNYYEDSYGDGYFYNYDYYSTYTATDGPFRGNIQVELTSPSGTKSIILPYRSTDVASKSYTAYPFISVHFWGENPNGDWTLIVRNRNDYVTGTLSVTIHDFTFYGTSETPAAVSRIPVQCHSSCDPTRGCAASGAEFCDGCLNLRHAETLECIDQCPSNFTERSGYCYNASIPEPECVRQDAYINRPIGLLMSVLVFVVMLSVELL